MRAGVRARSSTVGVRRGVAVGVGVVVGPEPGALWQVADPLSVNDPTAGSKPHVAALVEGQSRMPKLAVSRRRCWRPRWDRGVVRAAGADRDLPDAADRIGDAGRRLRIEALVDVVVAVEDEVGVGRVELFQKGGVFVLARPPELNSGMCQ